MNSVGVILQKIGFFNGGQFKTVFFQFGKDGFLYGQISCESVQFFNQDQLHAVCMKRRQHFHECGPILQLFLSTDATLFEDANNFDVVGGGVEIDALKLASVPIASFLAFSAHS